MFPLKKAEKAGGAQASLSLVILKPNKTHVDLFADCRGREYSLMKSSFLLFVGSFSMALGSSV